MLFSLHDLQQYQIVPSGSVSCPPGMTLTRLATYFAPLDYGRHYMYLGAF